MKQYRHVLGPTALLLVLTLTGPSVATLACEWMCTPRHQAGAAAATTGCHDHGASASESAALSAGHACHELADSPLLISPSRPQAALAPAFVPVAVAVVDDDRRRARLLASITQLEPHEPSSVAIPLRI